VSCRNVSETFLLACLGMLIKFYCLMTAAYSCIKKAKRLQKSGFGRPRLVAVVCSLKCFEIGLICWQLISVKATKHLLGLPFLPKPGKCLTVSAFCRGRQHLNFPPRSPENHAYRCRETTWE